MSPMLFLLCVCWVALATASSAKPYDIEDAELHFERFMEQYNKQYFNEAEKQIRFEIFKSNLCSVNKMNEKSNHAVFGITKFMDLTKEEFLSTYTGLRTTVNDNDDPFVSDCVMLFDDEIPHVDAPASFDWREHGVVTRVKNQNLNKTHCGSCYAFAATGNIEGQYALKYGKLQEFSEQQIVDCGHMLGCLGGRASQSFRELIKMGGAVSEADYPYTAEHNDCNFDQSKVKVKLSDCRSYNLTSQEKVKQLLYKTGPIAINFGLDFAGWIPRNDRPKYTYYYLYDKRWEEDGITMNERRKRVHLCFHTHCTFRVEGWYPFNLAVINKKRSGRLRLAIASEAIRKYTTGIISDELCSKYPVTHAVLLVGYGTENGNDFWIVKNTWGEEFGEDGYFRMQRGEGVSSCKMLNDNMATSIL